MLILAVAAVIRVYRLGAEDYWLDELHSLANSAGRRAEFESIPHGEIVESWPKTTELTPQSTVANVWRKMREDTHPPLYFVLLLLWRRIAGDGEFAVRLLSVVFSLASIVPASLILREYGRVRAAIAAAAVLAFSFTHVHMAQEARPYALAVLTVTLSFWALASLHARSAAHSKRQRALWLIVYGGAVYLSLLTHYFTALFLLGQIVLLAAQVRGRLLRSVVAAAVGAIVVFLLTWGLQLRAQLPLIRDQAWLVEDRPDHTVRTVIRVSNTPVRFLLAHPKFITDDTFELNVVLAVAGAALLVLPGTWLYRARRREALLFAGWYFVPLLLLAALDFVTGKQLLAHVRYLSSAAPAFACLLALAFDGLRVRMQFACAAAAACAVAVTFRLPTQVNPHNRLAAALVAERARPGDLVIYDAMGWPPFWAARIFHNVSYYLSQYVGPAGPPFVLLKDQPSENLLRRMAGYDRLIVVAPRYEEVPNPLPDRFELAEKTGYILHVGFIYILVRTSQPLQE